MSSLPELQAADCIVGQIATTSTATVTAAGAEAYTALDVIGTAEASNLSFATFGNKSGGEFIITGARLRIDVNAVPSGMAGFRLHLYNAAPTAIADNAAYNLPAGDRAKYIGYVTISTPVDFGDTIFAQDDNLNVNGKLAAGSKTVYGILQTVAAYTPAANTVFTVSLNVLGV